MTVEISQHQFSICQKANGQFCNVNAPLQPLANPPSFMSSRGLWSLWHMKSATLKVVMKPHAAKNYC